MELDHFVAVKLALLRAAIDQSGASGIAKGNVFARARKALQSPPPSR
jgi:hypothetical protein